jgi:glycosyltransferase involved in cell wall biosynthesis
MNLIGSFGPVQPMPNKCRIGKRRACRSIDASLLDTRWPGIPAIDTNRLPDTRMSRPTATVIIPCWNGERHLADTIRSWLIQSHGDFDLILLDDASEDRSVAIAREVAGDSIQIVQNEESKGLASNWNHAFSLAETDYVCLAHQDDLYDPRYLQTMLDHLEEYPSAGLIHCQARTINEDGTVFHSPIERFKLRFWEHMKNMDRGNVYRRLFHGNFICCPSIVYRRQVHSRVRGFDTSLSFCSDWDYSFRVLLAGMDIAAVPETLISYRRHRSNATRNHVASLNRYKEEMRTVEMALRKGEGAGLLGPGTHSSLAVRNNLLYDAFSDFESGNPEAALEKIRFGQAELPGFGKNGLSRSFRFCLALGLPGLQLLRMGLWAYLRMAPKRVS